jgi:TPR repeat protein
MKSPRRRLSLDEQERIAPSAFARAVEARVAGDLAAAEAAYGEAAGAGDREAAFRLGVIRHRDRRDHAGAVKAYEQAAAAGLPEAMHNLALLFAYELDRVDDARRLWHAAIERGDPLAMFDLGFFRWYEGDFRGAEEAFQRAIDEGNPSGHLHMGFLLIDEDRDEDALAAFERAAALGLDEAWTHVGWRLARLARLDEAEAALRRGREVGDVVSDDILHDVLEAQGRSEEAEAVLQELSDWARDEVSLDYRHLLATLSGEGLRAEALEQWTKEECDSRTQPEVAALLFDAPRLAEVETRSKLRIAYGDDEALDALAELYEKTGRRAWAQRLRGTEIGGESDSA